MESNSDEASVSPGATGAANLSEREHEILRLVATGASNKQIAQQLVISPNTVKVHLRNIFGKIGVATRTEAALYAIRLGLVQVPADAQLPIEENGQLEEGMQLPQSAPAAELVEIPGAVSQATATTLPAGARPLNRILWAGMLVGLLALALAGLAWWRQPKPIPITPTVPAPTPVPLWRVGSSMPTARSGIAVTTFESFVYAMGGEASNGVTGIVERYDLATNTWTSLSPKNMPVADVGAGAIGGLIYVPGGRLASGQLTDAFEAYDPRQDRWTARRALPQALSAYALAAFEGRLYIFGGWNGQRFVNTVFSYSPDTDSWSENSPMPIARGYAGAAVAGGKIYVIGGTDGSQALTANEAYTPEKDSAGETPWETHTPLPTGRSGLAATSVADIIHVVGGETDGPALPLLQYSPRNDQWRPLEAPPTAAWPTTERWTRLGLTAVESNLVAVGGLRNNSLVSTTLSYRVVFTIIFPALGP